MARETRSDGGRVVNRRGQFEHEVEVAADLAYGLYLVVSQAHGWGV
jgi:hypothetical protein